MFTEIKDRIQKKLLRDSFQLIFKNRDPFDIPFTNFVTEMLVLNPTDGYCLSKEQFISVLKAAQAIGEQKLYISEIESELDCFETYEDKKIYQCKHWIVESQIEINQYYELPIIIENAIYSTKG